MKHAKDSENVHSKLAKTKTLPEKCIPDWVFFAFFFVLFVTLPF